MPSDEIASMPQNAATGIVPMTGDTDLPRRELGQVDTSFYLVGIGASAGGLDAIKQLIAQLPEDFQHSFVIIQHLSPDYKSLMTEILARETRLTVREVVDDMAVEARHIYLIPPRANVVIQGTGADNRAPDDVTTGHAASEGLRFSLVDPMPRSYLNLPIDLFFESLAEAVGDRAVAIVLSGTGSDGSRGLRAVKDREGFVMVQEPETAEFDGMPRAALATRIVDSVEAPDAMIAELERYFRIRESGLGNTEQLFKGGDRTFAEIMRMVSEVAEIDFTQYKEPTVKRRIARRMSLRECRTLKAYLDLLQAEPGEIPALYREFLVGVTNFFRDLPAWWTLRDEALPRIFAEGDLDRPVRIWSAGCSTGEEAQTIALLCEDFRRRNEISRDFRVYATDVNANAIASAKSAVYPVSVLEEIPEELRSRDYLIFSPGTFQVTRELREKLIYTTHNVLVDAPFINTDLIVCRNLLIYFSSDMQLKAQTIFAFALRKGGFLFLGAAENAGRSELGFDSVNASARLFMNVRKPRARVSLHSDVAKFPIPKHHASPLPRLRRLSTRNQNQRGGPLTEVFTELLGHLTSAVFIIAEDGHIFETYGNYRSVINMPDEAFSSNLIELVDERLKSAVSLLLRRAMNETRAEKRNVKILRGEEIAFVDLRCSKIEWEAHPTAYAVTISETHTEKQAPAPDPVSDGSSSPGQQAYVSQLESEVESLQELLSRTAEDLGVSNEELQSTNEELTTSNEELQASNEELQSINEELHTINAEYSEKIVRLEEAHADIDNLLRTAELGIVLLDEKLCIRRINDSIAQYIDLRPEDIGRRLSDFSSSIAEGGFLRLLDDAALALQTGEETTRDIVTLRGQHAFARTRPFRAHDGSVSGVVIKLLDTTRLVDLQLEVAEQRDRLEGLLESEAAGYWDWNIPAHTEYLSPRFKSMLGYAEHEVENSPDSWQRLIHPDDLPGVMKTFDAHVASRGRIPYDNEVRYRHKDGSIVWVLCRGRVLEWDEDGAPVRMMGVHIDITALKNREQTVRQNSEEVQRFAFVAAHDLLQPMHTIRISLQMLIEDLTGDLPPEHAQTVSFLESAIDRMRRRITGILEYAKLTDKSFKPVRVDLTTLARDCIADLSTTIEEADAEVQVGELGAARGAAGLIERVFLNLIHNAVKYRSPERPCRITVDAAAAPRGQIGIRVRDNGIGIPAEQREKIFRLFSRLHNEDEVEGLGIGLSLCERIVHMHGGSIRVEETDGEGASMLFTLPGWDE